MNWLLRLFGIREIDHGEYVVECPECGQPIKGRYALKPVTPLEAAVADFEAGYIDTATLEQRVAAALGRN